MFHTDILFTGFYGFKNSGDDAFVEACSWGAHNFGTKTIYDSYRISKISLIR